MDENTSIPDALIAPCGMNCALCSRYLAHINRLKRSQCPGCRPGNRYCSYLFAKCSGMNGNLPGTATAGFCWQCSQYPCQHIKRMDKRYRRNYGMSVMDNLAWIRMKGVKNFAQAQYEKYRCPKCEGLISIHNGKCFHCDTVTSLVDRRTK